MLPEYTREELADGLDRVVEEILEKTGIQRPPIDAFAVAQGLAITVALDDRQEGRARYVGLKDRRRSGRRATILLRPEPRLERRHWAVAHEIGEHLAYHVFAQWGIDPRETEPNTREVVANNLAGRLLLPTVWFARDAASCDWDLIALKTRYPTASHELIARRMLECRPPVIISIFDQRRISFRQSNLPGRAPSPTAAEMQCWRDVHDGNHPYRLQSGPCIIQGWPIHEEGWQREILRVEMDEYASESMELAGGIVQS